MSTQTRGFPSGEMRASDADRDLALAELSEHFQTGRLTQEEFDERSARALQARTGRELSELFTDLPGPAQPGFAALDRSPSRRRPAPLVIVGVVAAIAVTNLLGPVAHVTIGPVGIGFGWVIPVFIVLVVLRRLARRR
jgi:Domain of unknown function (DUF1707)